jgi:Family of unknown function (DUF5675)
METPVWMRLFAQVASFLSSRLSSLTAASAQANPISSSAAPENAADSTSTSRTPQENILRVTRNPAMTTTDALFGDMEYNGRWIAITMERTAVAIPEGVYQGRKRYSAHFGMTVVGIDVPNRTDIECHPANLPSQLLGCIAVGESKDNDALDSSRTAFERMMAVVPETFTVEICYVVPS